jgi:hypothetical protein
MKRKIGFFTFASVSLLLILSGAENSNAAKAVPGDMRQCELAAAEHGWEKSIKFSESYNTCCNPDTKICVSCNKDETKCMSYEYIPKRNIVQGGGGPPTTKMK